MSSDRSRAGQRCPAPPVSLAGRGKAETPHRTARKPVPAFPALDRTHRPTGDKERPRLVALPRTPSGARTLRGGPDT